MYSTCDVDNDRSNESISDPDSVMLVKCNLELHQKDEKENIIPREASNNNLTTDDDDDVVFFHPGCEEGIPYGRCHAILQNQLP